MYNEILCNVLAKMSQKTKSQLTETAQNLFHLMEQFAKLKKSQCINNLIFENSKFKLCPVPVIFL